MPKKTKRKAAPEVEAILDVYEKWLKNQPVKNVRAKAGFISSEET